MLVQPRRRSLHAVGPPRARALPVEELLAAPAQAVLGIGIAAGATAAVVLLLVLLTVAAPLAAILLPWLAWRSDRASAGAVARLRARWGRSARVLPGGA